MSSRAENPMFRSLISEKASRCSALLMISSNSVPSWPVLNSAETAQKGRPSWSKSFVATLPRPAGTQPVNALPASSMRSNLMRLPISDGIVP